MTRAVLFPSPLAGTFVESTRLEGDPEPPAEVLAVAVLGILSDPDCGLRWLVVDRTGEPTTVGLDLVRIVDLNVQATAQRGADILAGERAELAEALAAEAARKRRQAGPKADLAFAAQTGPDGITRAVQVDLDPDRDFGIG